ncbi:MAG: 2Fe-2S iron-sulfur cluster-binding protein, partial [Pseudomonadota bacterium]
MNQINRIAGGQIDRSRQIKFRFNGIWMRGHPGDTLASALMANGQQLVGRSFKYHRPRGIFTAGPEEPNALVELRSKAHQEPNTRATMVELYDNLWATSQNHKGSLEFDLLAINDWFSPFLSAGFYYKTFMWPRSFWERIYEPVIRAAAGLGSLSMEEDPDAYDKGFLHCDILVIGSGPAGLMAALTAARSGARVILADEDFQMGGRLNSETYEIDGYPAADWVAKTLEDLTGMDNVRIMRRTAVYGTYDHGIYGALERKTDHLAQSGGAPRHVLWRIYSKRAILAAGATERPIAFADNDRPGIMLSGAVRSYINRFGVTPGQEVAVFTNNDDGWRTAQDLINKGVHVPAIVDPRDIAPRQKLPDTRVFMGQAVNATIGRKGLKAIGLTNGQVISCDALAVSGGWNPNVHLTCHQRGRPVWRDDIRAFVPGEDLPIGMSVAGATNGVLTLAASLQDGARVAKSVLEDIGKSPVDVAIPQAEDEASDGEAFWHVKNDKKRAWLDLQNDVTVKDVKIANAEGFRSVELLKRYTTLGMATDQGKTSNIAGMAILAEEAGKTIPEVGTTIFRPPYTPVPIGAFAGRSRGKDFRPFRITPSHDWAAKNGASFVEVGNWLRAEWYARPGEKGWRDSVDREARMTRQSVGICDVT